MGNDNTNALGLAERQLPFRSLTPPDPGTVHLWLLDLAALGSPLQPGEPVTGNSLTAPQQRTLRRFYLRLLLGSYLGLAGKDVHIDRSRRGKPALDARHHDTALQFSLAASAGHCLVGITTGSVVGVDLEPRGRQAARPLALARRYFSEVEWRNLKALESTGLDEAFLHTWACKEAVVKAGGTGIANALCRFTVDVRPGEPAAVLAMDDDEAEAWQLRSFVLADDLVGAVTVRYPSLDLEGYRLLPP